MEGGACRSQEEEVDWAIEKEKEIGYNFLIPVILDEKAWNEIEIEELKNRIYLKLNGFTTSDIKSFADELNDLTSTMRHPKIVSKNSRQTTLLLTCVFSSIT